MTSETQRNSSNIRGADDFVLSGSKSGINNNGANNVTNLADCLAVPGDSLVSGNVSKGKSNGGGEDSEGAGDDLAPVESSSKKESNFATSSYKDFSHIPKSDSNSVTSMFKQASAKEPTFPAKLHLILSNPQFEDIVAWMPHGRSWRILKPDVFEDRVLPLFFCHCRLSSFMRQVNGWGFKRIKHGPDYNSYYNELFLRGLPHLVERMRRESVSAKSKGGVVEDEPAPDLYRISEQNPLPENPSMAEHLRQNAVPGGGNVTSMAMGNALPVPGRPMPGSMPAMMGGMGGMAAGGAGMGVGGMPGGLQQNFHGAPQMGGVHGGIANGQADMLHQWRGAPQNYGPLGGGAHGGMGMGAYGGGAPMYGGGPYGGLAASGMGMGMGPYGVPSAPGAGIPPDGAAAYDMQRRMQMGGYPGAQQPAGKDASFPGQSPPGMFQGSQGGTPNAGFAQMDMYGRMPGGQAGNGGMDPNFYGR